jgi:anaerobic magnesium-protoporphyrin IX monomethyl ester cyclase
LVYSDISGLERYGSRKYYSGLGSISAVLRAAGHETQLLYLDQELSPDEFLARVEAASPGLVGFSATTHQYPYVKEYASCLKSSRPGLLLLCGGIHPTLAPEAVEASGAFDIVCLGEGEYPLRDLADHLERGRDYLHVENLWIRHNGHLFRNGMRPLIANLSELPYVDRDLFDYEEMLADSDGWVDMMAGRGCPYNCSYCCNPALRGRYGGLGQYVRFRSVEHLLGEIRSLQQCYDIETINFQDDVFTLDRKWTLDFCHAFGAEFDYPFWINSRVERISDETLVRSLAEAGCAGIRIGVENGDERLRASVLKRTMTNEEIAAAFRLARSYGLRCYTCNMIGIPGETPESIQATIDLNRELTPDGFQFSVFYPYPMTELHDLSVAQSLVKPEAELTSYYGRESVLDLPTLTREELAAGYERFDALQAELALKRASPLKHRIYILLLKLYRGNSPRLHRHLQVLRRLRKFLGQPAQKGET